MKKKIAMLSAILVAISALTGCGNSGNSMAPSDPGSSNSTSESSAAESEKDKEEITQLMFVNTAYPVAEDELKDFYNSPVYAKLREKTGVELLIRGADADQAAIYFASGDLGDITNITSQAEILPAVESENILPLNDLVAQYGPNVSFQDS